MNSDKTRHLPTALYRMFDADGRLLYIGQSQQMALRMRAHDRHSWWFPFVTDLTVEWLPTRDAAMVAEALAIKEESPRYNAAHADRDWTDWSHLTDDEVAACREAMRRPGFMGYVPLALRALARAA